MKLFMSDHHNELKLVIIIQSPSGQSFSHNSHVIFKVIKLKAMFEDSKWIGTYRFVYLPFLPTTLISGGIYIVKKELP